MGLVISYTDLRDLVGRHLGWGTTYANWSSDTTKVADAATIISSGLRMVYFPIPVIEGEPSHQWSFMQPTVTLSTVSGVNTYPLPADFVVLKTPFTLGSGETAVRMAQKRDTHLLEMVRYEDKSGAPEFFAMRAATQVEGGMPGYEVRFWPRPDAVYALTYQYLSSPLELSTDNPYHLGGPQLSELVIESVLASADRFLNDVEGMHDKKFRELLVAAIQLDQGLNVEAGDGEDIWSAQDNQTTLAVTRAYLRRVIGRHLGYGPHPAIWNRQQVEEIRLAMERGLRKFYNPPVLPGERYAHEWSFLRPLANMTFVGSQHTYELPEDFAMFAGPITYTSEAATLYPPIEIYGEEFVRQRRQWTTSTARPAVAAVLPVTSPSGVTRYQLTLWPTPDTPYGIQFRYQVSPDSLTDEQELPVGGPVHAETVVEACLSAADAVSGSKDKASTGRFMERLATSVSHDRKVHAPDMLGYNGDGNRSLIGEWHEHDENIVTYNGTSY